MDLKRHDVPVQPLDEGQERELVFACSRRSAWVNLSPLRRTLGAIAVLLPTAVLAGAIAALAGGPWLLVGIGAAAIGSFGVLPQVLMPERMLRASVRMTTPTAESMKRGDSNRSWPG